jgi:hypothetical protein
MGSSAMILTPTNLLISREMFSILRAFAASETAFVAPVAAACPNLCREKMRIKWIQSLTDSTASRAECPEPPVQIYAEKKIKN